MAQDALIKIGAFILVALLLAALGAHYFAVLDELEATQIKLSEANVISELRNAELKAVTIAKDELEIKLSKSEVTRNKIRADLQASLSKLRKQPVPTECKRAIEWSIENKEDLSWPSP